MLDADRSLRVVVCDWRIPQMDGLELCRALRANRKDYVSFLLLTEIEPPWENRQRAYEAGIDDFLTKPIELAELDNRLRVVLRILDYENRIESSIVVVCCYCKNVRKDDETWEHIEASVTRRTGIHFSHTVCPACYEEHVEPQIQELPKP